MPILLDTHTFLWYILANPQLSARAQALIQASENEKFLSIASLWEISIKVSTGKLMLSEPLESYFAEQIHLNSIQLLPGACRPRVRAAVSPPRPL